MRAKTAGQAYFSEVLTVVNVEVSLVPMPLTEATMTMLMPAAMMAYSMAVAPDSSARKLVNNRRIPITPVDAFPRNCPAPCSDLL